MRPRLQAWAKPSGLDESLAASVEKLPSAQARESEREPGSRDSAARLLTRSSVSGSSDQRLMLDAEARTLR